MNILKLLIPTGQTKGIKEIESYTVSWETFGRILEGETKHYKVFIDKEEGKEFIKSLRYAEKLLRLEIINVSIDKN